MAALQGRCVRPDPRRESRDRDNARILEAASDLLAAPSVSRMPLAGPLLAAFKRLLRRMLATPFALQTRYNRANAELVRSLEERLARAEEELERLRRPPSP